MGIVQFLVGVALIALGMLYVIRRERLPLARRSSATPAVRTPMTYLAIGVICGLAGAIEVILALR